MGDIAQSEGIYVFAVQFGSVENSTKLYAKTVFSIFYNKN